MANKYEDLQGSSHFGVHRQNPVVLLWAICLMVSFTTATRIHFVFCLFMFKFENPSKVLITKALICVTKAKPRRILVAEVKRCHHSNRYSDPLQQYLHLKLHYKHNILICGIVVRGRFMGCDCTVQSQAISL